MTFLFHNGRYSARFAQTDCDLHACQQLRHRCFFGGEGLDHDSFDVAYDFVHVPFDIAAEHAKSGKDYIINNLQNLKYKEK